MYIYPLNEFSSTRPFLWCILFICFFLLINSTDVKAQALVPDYPISLMALSGDGTRLAVLGHIEQNAAGETVYYVDILDAFTLQILSSVDIGTNQPNMLDISPEGRWLVYNVPYTELRAIDTLTGQSNLLYGGGPLEVEAIAWNPIDGRVVHDEGISIWIGDLYGQVPGTFIYNEGSGRPIDFAWSSSGRHLATTTSSPDIEIWSEDQIALGRIVNVPPATRFSGYGGGLAWSPSDQFIASARHGSIVIFEIATGQQEILATPAGETLASLTWSPDGTQIAAGGIDTIWIWEVSTGELVETITLKGVVDMLIWSPYLGILHNGNESGLYRNGNLVSSPLPTACASHCVTGFTLSGKLAYSSYFEADDTTQIVIYDIESREETILTNDVSDNTSPDLSPTQSQIVFVSNRDGDAELFIMNADGTNVRQLTNNTIADTFPQWSPDETKIVYMSNTGTSNDIFLINSDGMNIRNLTDTIENESGPAWSPDGQKIVFESGFNIYIINVDGTNMTQITSGENIYIDPKWSPDGSKIAFAGPGENFFYVNSDGTGLTQITNETSDTGQFVWSDNSQIMFQTANEGFFLINLDGTGRTPVEIFLPQGAMNLNLSSVIVNNIVCTTGH